MDYGFVGRTPEFGPPSLSAKQVRDLCAYIDALADVRGEQLGELGFDAAAVAHQHSPMGLREVSDFLRHLYPTAEQRRETAAMFTDDEDM